MPWKSRWSWLRFVKHATSNDDLVGPMQHERVAGDLHRARPARRPRRMRARMPCSSGDSGVVRTVPIRVGGAGWRHGRRCHWCRRLRQARRAASRDAGEDGRDGGLPVGAGHADRAQALGRTALDERGRGRGRASRVLDHEHGQAGGLEAVAAARAIGEREHSAPSARAWAANWHRAHSHRAARTRGRRGRTLRESRVTPYRRDVAIGRGGPEARRRDPPPPPVGVARTGRLRSGCA